jgi:hypothetical protein
MSPPICPAATVICRHYVLSVLHVFHVLSILCRQINHSQIIFDDFLIF